ncbi:MAG: hypothetical protein KJ798_04975 [Gammaproteobacteria bacterium]|uniref:hypothetical protein n=1 Tax=Limnobacter sp. TaxID=2003368 RepID=UPI001DD285FD|nr:hypothetical protein [Limnobacter sp.]MBU0784098.1 hypothetical protein [Gammaproteobacteria bacterium]MBU0849836.1 hypothetical protein [Gammaproteobacteria bacterium]MBU1266878.1 hypothetical protein [Gammaproteobacteria bacterium]MBU1528706.1 hypothetical protein [Gammaproteobacteria bacterium]MBU1779718.1 hypothetical protein [Gammaproteobacteria bacterium]
MKFHSLFALPLLVLALPSHAQTATQELNYKSVFEGYQAYSEPEIQNWPKVNEEVGEIGGWRVYAREPYDDKSSEDKAAPPQVDPHRQHGGAQ